MGKRREPSVNAMFGWFGRLPMKVKIVVAFIMGISLTVALGFFLVPFYDIYIAAEAVHALGILALVYKLTKKKNCSGLSLRSQELTAIFLAVRLYCTFVMEAGIHTALDFTTLIVTIWVIYMIRHKLKSTYNIELDNMPLYYTVVPCALLAILIHPDTGSSLIDDMLWAFCINLESVSVLPQLRVMQNAKMVEPFTAHYVFALGIAKFLGCAIWITEVIRSRGKYLFVFSGHLWIPMAFFAEIVQTFILADFCYYYAKSVVSHRRLMAMAIPV